MLDLCLIGASDIWFFFSASETNQLLKISDSDPHSIQHLNMHDSWATEPFFFDNTTALHTQCGAPWIAGLVCNYTIAMVYGTHNYSIPEAYKSTNLKGGAHIVHYGSTLMAIYEF